MNSIRSSFPNRAVQCENVWWHSYAAICVSALPVQDSRASFNYSPFKNILKMLLLHAYWFPYWNQYSYNEVWSVSDPCKCSEFLQGEGNTANGNLGIYLKPTWNTGTWKTSSKTEGALVYLILTLSTCAFLGMRQDLLCNHLAINNKMHWSKTCFSCLEQLKTE